MTAHALRRFRRPLECDEPEPTLAERLVAKRDAIERSQNRIASLECELVEEQGRCDRLCRELLALNEEAGR